MAGGRPTKKPGCAPGRFRSSASEGMRSCASALPSVPLQCRFGLPLALEDDPAVAGIHDHGVPGAEIPPQQLVGELIFDEPLDGAPEGPRAEAGVKALLG